MFFKTWGSFNNNEGVCLMILENSLGGEGAGFFVLEKKGGQGRGFICICSIIVFVAAAMAYFT